MLRRLMLSAALVGTLFATAAAYAEQFARVGDYEIHYSAVNSSF